MRYLITGGTGSLGHALVPVLLKVRGTERVVILSRDEYKQALMRDEFPDPRLELILGDVRDQARMELAMGEQPDVIIHAAALKRVDSVARDPDEVFKTNVLGTRNTLHAALNSRRVVPKFLLISSDKACQPLNSYGISKAMAEQLTLGFNTYSMNRGMVCGVVRYGNVLDSRGSVLEVWKRQVAQGQLLTLTDPGMTRFAITLSEAVDFIRSQLLLLNHSSEKRVFIPTLPCFRVVDLLQAFMHKKNLLTHPYVITGLRPGGEKLHEVLDIDPLVSSDAGPFLSIQELQEKIT